MTNNLDRNSNVKNIKYLTTRAICAGLLASLQHLMRALVWTELHQFEFWNPVQKWEYTRTCDLFFFRTHHRSLTCCAGCVFLSIDSSQRFVPFHAAWRGSSFVKASSLSKNNSVHHLSPMPWWGGSSRACMHGSRGGRQCQQEEKPELPCCRDQILLVSRASVWAHACQPFRHSKRC